MNNCFIILAAGKGERFNSKIPKPYYLYKGKPLIQHSIDKAKNYKKIHLAVFLSPLRGRTENTVLSCLLMLESEKM